MRYIVDHIALMSLDDPDFLNNLVFNSFFNADVFLSALHYLVNRDSQMADNQLSTLTSLFQQLALKAAMTEPEQRADIERALNETKCQVYSQVIRLYYFLTFTVSGKLQFDPTYAALMKNSGAPFLDRFVQIMTDNIFIFGGPDEDPRQKRQ
jgi:hypothetical protein